MNAVIVFMFDGKERSEYRMHYKEFQKKSPFAISTKRYITVYSYIVKNRNI